MDRYVPTLVALALLLGAVAGYAVGAGAGAGGLSDPRPLSDPQVERFDQTASGCRGTVTPAGGTTVGPGGRFAAFGVMDTDSPDADLAMEITRTAPDEARVTTYRIDLSSRARNTNATCAGDVAYRLNVTVDYREAMRVAVYEDGEITACGGTACGPLVVDEKRRWWANGSVEGDSRLTRQESSERPARTGTTRLPRIHPSTPTRSAVRPVVERGTLGSYRPLVQYDFGSPSAFVPR